MDLKLKTKLEMFRNTEHENFYNGSSKGMGTISTNTADEMYELINELERALIKDEASQDKALHLAGVSGSSIELIERLLQNDLKAAGKLTRLELDEQTEHELGLSIGRTKLALKEIKNHR